MKGNEGAANLAHPITTYFRDFGASMKIAFHL